MPNKIIFYIQSIILIGVAFLLKYLSLSTHAATSIFKSQQRFLDSMCKKDILQVEPVCQVGSNANLYFESNFLGQVSILISIISLVLLIYNQVKKIYPSKFNYLAIFLNIILILYSVFVWF